MNPCHGPEFFLLKTTQKTIAWDRQQAVKQRWGKKKLSRIAKQSIRREAKFECCYETCEKLVTSVHTAERILYMELLISDDLVEQLIVWLVLAEFDAATTSTWSGFATLKIDGWYSVTERITTDVML